MLNRPLLAGTTIVLAWAAILAVPSVAVSQDEAGTKAAHELGAACRGMGPHDRD